MIQISAYIAVSLIVIVILFQLLLAAGVPWSKASMGGKYPGKYPTKMRFIAIINALILLFFIAIILAESGFDFDSLKSISGIGIWVVTAFFLISTVMNSITPSKIERIWAPVSFITFIACLIVALN